MTAHKDFKQVSADMNDIGVLKTIKSICYNFEDQKHVPQSICKANTRLHNLKQAKHELPVQHCERCQNWTQVLEQCGGTIGKEAGLLKAVCMEKKISLAMASARELSMVSAATRERMLAIGFLLGADRSRHGNMIREFENLFVAGLDEWLKTLSDACGVMTNWKQERSTGLQINTKGVSFAMDGNKGKPRNRKNMTCFNCRKKGHLSCECNEDSDNNNDNNNDSDNNANTNV